MAALILSENIQYFSSDEKPRKILEYIDKLIVLFPDFEYFYIHTYEIILEPDFTERKKIYSINGEIRVAMQRLGYIETPRDANVMHVLTEKGRLVKSKGGHFKYLKSIEPKKDWFKIIPITTSIFFGILTIGISIWNIKLSKNRDKSVIEIEKQYKKIDSLKQKIKELEKK